MRRNLNVIKLQVCAIYGHSEFRELRLLIQDHNEHFPLCFVCVCVCELSFTRSIRCDDDLWIMIRKKNLLFSPILSPRAMVLGSCVCGHSRIKQKQIAEKMRG
jgi:hypothetical protein